MDSFGATQPRMHQPPPATDGRVYSCAEQRVDSAIHWAGLLVATLAVPALIWVAARQGIDPAHGPAILASLIYGATLLAMLGASALYNLSRGSGLGWLYRRLDHSAIYLKIAGTYTPFTLITGQGLWVMAGLWGAALFGVVLKCISPMRFRGIGLVLYLGMGWGGVLIFPDLLASLPPATVTLMVLGGLGYTFGVGFYLWTRLPFHYAIWHLHVLGASMLFYAAVLVLVLSL